MTQSPAGWHRDQEDPSIERYWDGQQWTTQTRPAPIAAPTEQFAAVPTTPQSPKNGTPWYRKGWVIGVAALLIGIGIGAASGSSADPKDSTEYKDLKRELAVANEDVETYSADLKKAQAALGDIPHREQVLGDAEEALAIEQEELKNDKADVKRREKAVGIAEVEVEKNTISGDGVYEVGVDIKAGRYKTTGQEGCYYAILNSTDTSDIADNANLDGPGFFTVRKGQYIEISDCADFVLQR